MFCRTLPRMFSDVVAQTARRTPTGPAPASNHFGNTIGAESAGPIRDTESLAGMLRDLGYDVVVQCGIGGTAACLIALDTGESRHDTEVELDGETDQISLRAEIGQIDLMQAASPHLAQLLMENARCAPSYFGCDVRGQRLSLYVRAENRHMTRPRLKIILRRLRKLIRDTRPAWTAVMRPSGGPFSSLATAPANTNGKVSEEKTWFVFKSAKGRFGVLLPESPRIETHVLTTELGPVELHVVSTHDGNAGVSYGVCYSDLECPANGDGNGIAEGALTRARAAMIELMGGHVQEERTISLQGHRGMELMVGSVERGKALARVFCIGHRFFQVLAVGTDGCMRQPSIQFFLDSFHLIRE